VGLAAGTDVGDARVQKLYVLDMVKVCMREEHAVDLRLGVGEIGGSQHFLGVQAAQLRQQSELKIVAEVVKLHIKSR